MNGTALERVDQYIAGLERRAEDARKMRAILVASPELADALLGTLQAMPPPVPPAVSPISPTANPPIAPEDGDDEGATDSPPLGGPMAQRYFTQIAGALRSGKNAGKTIEDIIQDTELSKNAVIHVLYKTHRDKFVKSPSPHGGRKKVWRLANPDEQEGEGAHPQNPMRNVEVQHCTPVQQGPMLFGGSRLEQLQNFLERNGPLGRRQIIEMSGIPEGTIGMLLHDGPFVQDEMKRWSVRPGQNGVPHTEEDG